MVLPYFAQIKLCISPGFPKMTTVLLLTPHCKISILPEPSPYTLSQREDGKFIPHPSTMQRFFLFFLILSFCIGCSQLKGRKKGDKLQDQIAAAVNNGKTMLVGDYAIIGNNHLAEIRGVGLVQNLPGTGADDVSSLQRQIMYEEMIKIGVRNPRNVLADPGSAVVEIYARLPPGIQEGEPFDVEVMVPNPSEVKSLRGGWLMRAPLKEMMGIDGDLRVGRPLAFVEGPIMVDPLATEKTNPAALKKGTILGGATVKESRNLVLTMKSGQESVFLTDRIAKEINHRFYTATGQKKGVATAKTDVLIMLDVHPTYRNDVDRYIKIIQSIACYENQPQQLERIERLQTELMNPTTAQKAAFQLEAIGKPGIAALRSALRSQNDEVRFHAGTALAYLGDASAARILADLARDYPAFRVYALNALSVLKSDVEAEICLQELLHVSSAETRYGAFRALYLRNPYDQMIRGENLGNQFSYHGIASQGPPLVHLSKSKRPEVVVFGLDVQLTPPLTLDAGPYISVMASSPNSVVVSKYAAGEGIDERRTVSNKLDTVIRAVVELGGTYPDVFQMIRQAEIAKNLTCRVEVDCLPEGGRIYRRKPSPEEEEEENVKLAAVVKPKRTTLQRMNPATWFEKNPDAASSEEIETRNAPIRE